jgi:hypothetical protein
VGFAALYPPYDSVYSYDSLSNQFIWPFYQFAALLREPLAL